MSLRTDHSGWTFRIPSEHLRALARVIENMFPSPSTDGKQVVFMSNRLGNWISERDGYRCIVAQRLEPATKKLLGEMFYVHRVHGARRSMMHYAIPTLARFTVARDKIVFSLAEHTGNISLAEFPVQ